MKLALVCLLLIAGPADASLLSLRCTAPNSRNSGTCDEPILIPASADTIYVQFLAINWAVPGSIRYQQVITRPGNSIQWIKVVPPGFYFVVCRVIGKNGIAACRDTIARFEAQ